MGSITQKIFELLSEGSSIEERRSREIISKSNWFDALDGRETASGNGKESKGVGNTEERNATKKSNLNE